LRGTTCTSCPTAGDLTVGHASRTSALGVEPRGLAPGVVPGGLLLKVGRSDATSTTLQVSALHGPLHAVAAAAASRPCRYPPTCRSGPRHRRRRRDAAQRSWGVPLVDVACPRAPPRWMSGTTGRCNTSTAADEIARASTRSGANSGPGRTAGMCDTDGYG
jgi:hypothetical protein